MSFLPCRLMVCLVVCVAAERAIAAEPAPAASAEPAPTMIVNFTETVPNVYGYATWKDNFGVVPKAGFRVLGGKGAQGDGGMCQNLDPALDLSKCTYIEIALAVQPGNEVPQYNIALGDGDGTQVTARVRIDQLMPGQPVWMRLKVADFGVSTRDPGKDSKMDWSKVAQWHLQGDWSVKAPAKILFIALRAR